MKRTDWHDLFVRFVRAFSGNPDARKVQETEWYWDVGGKDFALVKQAMNDIIEATKAKIDLGGANPIVPSLIKVKAAIEQIERKKPKKKKCVINCSRCNDQGTVNLQQVPDGKMADQYDILMYNFLVRSGVDGFTGEEVTTVISKAYACSCRAGIPFSSGEHFAPLVNYDLSLLDDRFHRLWEQHNHIIPTPDSAEAVISMVEWGMKRKEDAKDKSHRECPNGSASPLRLTYQPLDETGQDSQDSREVENVADQSMATDDIPF